MCACVHVCVRARNILCSPEGGYLAVDDFVCVCSFVCVCVCVCLCAALQAGDVEVVDFVGTRYMCVCVCVCVSVSK